ncbi:hypothetical protein HK096_004106, partial [Nowakowskiella sp. JEL0078]
MEQPNNSRKFQDYPITPVPFTSVQLTDAFWAPRIETNRTITIPFAFQQCIDSKRLQNFEAAKAALNSTPWTDYVYTDYPFDDTDIYKIIEGVAFSLSAHKDPNIEIFVDDLCKKIAAAQEPDGYIFTARTFNPSKPHRWAGSERWVKEKELSHELYCFGHLFEAASAYYQATGKRVLLDISIRAVDLLEATFGPGKEEIYPGHQIIEMGLVRLYRLTGESRYLQLAKFFLDCRRPEGHPGSPEYNQAHLPVIEQTTAVGHAVRAAYMYAGMADIAALTGDASYITAINRIWEDVVTSKLYITGGIGSRHDGEAFGDPFELPNSTAYNETCASIANVYWNHRLFLLDGNRQYIDVMERSLYNALLAGISLDGCKFFYPNPLESFGDYERSPWFGCACCPGNLTRFFASISGYQYATRENEIFVNLYSSGSANITLESGICVSFKQETKYPWEGKIETTISNLDKPSEFKINFRIPSWVDGEEVVTGGLYSFVDSSDVPKGKVLLHVNNKLVNGEYKNGYISVCFVWKEGDTFSLVMPMKVRRIMANPRVTTNIGRIAFQRGPIVYCLESPDNGDLDVHSAIIPRDTPVTSFWDPDLLSGVMVLRLGEFCAIPYYAWANRGKSHMN